MFKKFIISQLSKIKVASKEKEKIIFKVSSLKLIPAEYKEYERFLFQALEKLKGIKDVKVDMENGKIVVIYDSAIVKEEKVLKWAEIVKKVGINNYDLIEKYGEKNLDFVVKTIEKQLDDELKNI
ncbi:hypothetical protein HMPREF1092_00029 [Clostridium thermobutyricum]|uniref:HMA domain-containing protein n=1 Tax=Clostridium thermobutyricum TaxID=29372 RepID=N9Y710_9CLOT|nr:heavy metal-associated domain-containing protein [Clostridium thermobutyricum]ENZ04009.1 hypothetical protein HMPREF1092_00029 [Clostridium thermobutyricum]